MKPYRKRSDRYAAAVGGLNLLAKPEICVIVFSLPGIEPREATPGERGEQRALGRLAHNPRGESERNRFFLFGFALNP